MTEYAPDKTEEYPSDTPQFSKLRVLQKLFEVTKHNSLPLARNHVGIFVLGHYQFPVAALSEICSLLGTDVQQQFYSYLYLSSGKYPSIFLHQIEAIVYLYHIPIW